MKTSQLVTYLQNEIRKHGDREVRVIADDGDDIVVGRNIVVVSKEKNITDIKVSS